MKLKKLLGDAAACALLAGGAMAETIGYSSNNFDDNFQAILRTTAEDYAKSLGHELQVEVARKDVDAQLSQVQNLIAAGVDAIIVPPVSTEATSAITEMVKAAGIPLIYINRRPADVEALGGKSTYVGSDNAAAGMLLGEAVGGKGTAAELMASCATKTPKPASWPWMRFWPPIPARA